MMKPEIKVEVYLKGMELTSYGYTTKSSAYPALVSTWLPLGIISYIPFKVGKRKFVVTIEPLHKSKRITHGR